jgi:ABC-type antimicrobial peptide transport system permease subunit
MEKGIMMTELIPYSISPLVIVLAIIVMSVLIYFLKNTSTGRAGILAGLIGFIVSAVAVLTGTGELRYELMLPLGILGGLFSATIAMYSVVLCPKPARN